MALGAKLVVVGEDFHFGHGRKGKRRLSSPTWGAPVRISRSSASAWRPDKAGEAVSSTSIRRLLADGDVSGASPTSSARHPPGPGGGRSRRRAGRPRARISDGQPPMSRRRGPARRGHYACWYGGARRIGSTGRRFRWTPPDLPYPRRSTASRGLLLLDFRRRPLTAKRPRVSISWSAYARSGDSPVSTSLIAQMALDCHRHPGRVDAGLL